MHYPLWQHHSQRSLIVHSALFHLLWALWFSFSLRCQMLSAFSRDSRSQATLANWARASSLPRRSAARRAPMTYNGLCQVPSKSGHTKLDRFRDHSSSDRGYRLRRLGRTFRHWPLFQSLARQSSRSCLPCWLNWCHSAKTALRILRESCTLVLATWLSPLQERTLVHMGLVVESSQARPNSLLPKVSWIQASAQIFRARKGTCLTHHHCELLRTRVNAPMHQTSGFGQNWRSSTLRSNQRRPWMRERQRAPAVRQCGVVQLHVMHCLLETRHT